MQAQIAAYTSELFEVSASEIQALNQYFYPYEKDSGKYIARVLDEPDFAEQTTEVAWLNYLANQGVGIARAVPSVNGALVERISFGEAQYCVVSLERAEGAPPTDREWNRHLFRKLGREIGKMHCLTRRFHDEFPDLHRAHWYEADIYNLQFIPERFNVARSKCAEIVQQVRSYPQDSATYGLIHGDIGPLNLHLWNNEITFFDTDECELHFYVHDLGVLINFAVELSFNGTSINDYAEAFVGNLLEGYAEDQELTAAWIERLPVFIKLRELMSFIDAFLEWDMTQISLHQRILLNRYENALENDIPVLNIDFKQFV